MRGGFFRRASDCYLTEALYLLLLSARSGIPPSNFHSNQSNASGRGDTGPRWSHLQQSQGRGGPAGTEFVNPRRNGGRGGAQGAGLGSPPSGRRALLFRHPNNPSRSNARGCCLTWLEIFQNQDSKLYQDQNCILDRGLLFAVRDWNGTLATPQRRLRTLSQSQQSTFRPVVLPPPLLPQAEAYGCEEE